MGNSVGQQLRTAREKFGVSIEDAARATHIKLPYLQELENDHPELLPSPVQARGFLRLYASFLHIPAQPLIENWDKPVEPEPPTSPVAEGRTAGGEPSEKPEDKTTAGQTSELPKNDPQSVLIENKTTLVKRRRKSKKFFPKSHPSRTNLFTPAKQRGKSIKTAEPQTESISAEQPAIKVEETSTVAQVSPLSDLSLEKSQAEEKTALTAEVPQILSEPQKSSAEIFIEIGTVLRERREMLNLSLADVERFTHLKRPYLEALEAGHFDDLPSTVQGRGMLNNYATFLSMDENVVITQYAAALEAKRLERLPPSKSQPIVSGKIRINIPEPFRKYMNADLLLGGALILAIFIFLLWGSVSVFGTNSSKQTIEAPSISEVLQTTPTFAVTLAITLTPQSNTTPGAPTNVAGGAQLTSVVPTPVVTKNAAPVQLYIVAQQRAYLRVSVDGKIIFDGRVIPGNVYTYSGNKNIELLTGNASALEVYFNQTFVGKLGNVGQVANLSFTEKGMSTPVPAPTEKPTATSKPTITPTP